MSAENGPKTDAGTGITRKQAEELLAVLSDSLLAERVLGGQYGLTEGVTQALYRIAHCLSSSDDGVAQGLFAIAKSIQSVATAINYLAAERKDS